MKSAGNTGRRGFLSAGLGIAALLSFSVCLGRGAFVSTSAGILHLPLLSNARHLGLILSPEFMMFTDGQLRPLAYALLAVVRTVIAADQTLFWHLWMVVGHWLNSLLVASLVLHLGGRRRDALLAGLAVVLHPLGTVVVNDVAQYHHVLGLTALLGSLRCYLHQEPLHVPSRFHGLALLIFAVGLFVSKVLFILPLLLLLLELLYRRADIWMLGRRVGPFLLVTILAAPLFVVLAPHPLHYTYTDFGEGAAIFSLLSAIGAMEYYVPGLLWGQGLPVVLHEIARQIYTPLDLGFMFWALVGMGMLAAAGWLLWRRNWLGLAIFVVFLPMVPFSTTLWNVVDDYVAWKYLYTSVAGLGLVLGLATTALRQSRRGHGNIATAALWLMVLLLGYAQVQLNARSITARGYWEYVRSRNPSSQTAAIELGRLYLHHDDLPRGMDALLSAQATDLAAASTVLCRYFARKGQLLPAAVHLRMAMRRGSGLQFGHSEPLVAAVMQAARAYDHAESALGRVLTANPYDLDAMERLATIWAIKGYVRAAERMCRRVQFLWPQAPQVEIIRSAIARRCARAGTAPRIQPPPPSWLRYATQGFYDERIQQQIIAYGAAHPQDPIIGLEAGACLIRSADYAGALSNFRQACTRLPSSAFAWAMRCWAATEMKAYDEARSAGLRALQLDSDNATVHNSIGILYGRMAEDEGGTAELHSLAEKHFRKALQINPRHVSARINLARELKFQGKTDEAISIYRYVLRRHPDLAEAHFSLANLLADRGDTQEAVRHYRKAIEYRHEYAEAYHNLGTALLQQQAYRPAVESFLRALKIRPEMARARDALAITLLGRGAFQQAIAVLNEGLRVTPAHTRGALLLASVLATCPRVELRDAEKALTIARRVNQALPGAHPEALLVLVDALVASGHPQEAQIRLGEARGMATRSGSMDLLRRIQRREQQYGWSPTTSEAGP